MAVITTVRASPEKSRPAASTRSRTARGPARAAPKKSRPAAHTGARTARRIACATLEGCGGGSGGFTAARSLEARRERSEAAVNPDLAAADRRLERRARKGERLRSGERAEQHRAQDASGRVRKRRHVE